MPSRIKMNSKSIQEAFPEVYRNFFLKNEIVVSAPRDFWWTGEYSELFGGMAITQKFPIRIYIGLKPREGKNKIAVGSYNIFIPSQNKFEEKVFNRVSEQRLVSFLEGYLKQLTGESFGSFEINVLAELSIERGVGSFGTFGAALATALLLKNNIVNKAEVSTWQETRTQELIKRPLFNQTFRLSWKIEAAADSYQASGCRSFSALVNTAYPLVYFTEKRIGTSQDHEGARVPSNIEGDYDILDTIKYWGMTIEELFHFKFSPIWPIDISLIFSGELKMTGKIIRSTQSVRDTLDMVSDYIENCFKDDMVNDANIVPFFYQMVQEEKGKGLWKRYIESLSVISLETLKYFKEIFESGSEESLNGFFRSINCYQDVFPLLNVASPTLNQICSYINHEGYKNGEDHTGIKICGSAGGGDVLFVTPYGKSQTRDTVIKYVEELRAETKKDIWLDYASWIDGFEKEGVRLEQDIKDNFTSPFVSEETIVLKKYNSHGQAETEIYSLDEFEREREKMDLLIDDIYSKIYIRGQVLTSKDIHSAKKTIETLKILLKNFGRQVPAQELPSSSYVDRNEMQGKIVSPLIKAVEKMLKRKLPLVITGSLGKDFSLRISPSDIKIYLLEKKFA